MADIGGTRREEQMATLDEIGQQKQRISERLARLDAERTKLGDQLNELEIAERVLTRFGGKEASAPTERRRRGRPARTAPAAGKRRSARGRQQAPTVSMSEAILKALQPHDDGATAGEILSYLSREFGMTVRPNHLGMALQRHRRGGRLENRDQRWYLPPSAQSEQSGQSA
jgi:transposase